ncbi:hypothetical protein A3D08_03595 [Candidatus Roizmanbacteria bacterium RIFCSPHIGHO2_02_FULL_43_11]|uniref:Uncharacterized protein n=1 Tax=Candidatus Roizmanbacteria bacterium RIFCSPHIGHO2_02_FULL_43_11 TaxID=1802043 RepID=A0A1F7HGH9_9BACT|nr:MAG: hypothetical protein A3D08_03595 [Candidatus Roizmanbacteria bacterium RIFCSPHIGHO2_02_FULL_43_11]
MLWFGLIGAAVGLVLGKGPYGIGSGFVLGLIVWLGKESARGQPDWSEGVAQALLYRVGEIVIIVLIIVIALILSGL